MEVVVEIVIILRVFSLAKETAQVCMHNYISAYIGSP